MLIHSYSCSNVACPMIVTAFSIRSYTPYRPTHYSLHNAECEYVMCRCVDTRYYSIKRVTCSY